jgi:hypothetical protein
MVIIPIVGRSRLFIVYKWLGWVTLLCGSVRGISLLAIAVRNMFCTVGTQLNGTQFRSVVVVRNERLCVAGKLWLRLALVVMFVTTVLVFSCL